MHRHIGGYRRQTVAVVAATGLSISTVVVSPTWSTCRNAELQYVHDVLTDVVFYSASTYCEIVSC